VEEVGRAYWGVRKGGEERGRGGLEQLNPISILQGTF